MRNADEDIYDLIVERFHSLMPDILASRTFSGPFCVKSNPADVSYFSFCSQILIESTYQEFTFTNSSLRNYCLFEVEKWCQRSTEKAPSKCWE